MNDQKSKLCVLVCGMHRSGTSAITRSLSFLGLKLPATLLKDSESNPTGHWESVSINRLNDELLSKMKLSWQDFSAMTADEVMRYFNQADVNSLMDLIVAEYGDLDAFIVKDPRLCKLLPIWLEALDNLGIKVKIVLPIRHYQEVALSINKRNKLPLIHGHILWAQYVLAAELYTRGTDRVFINYESLVSNPEKVIKKIDVTLNLTHQLGTNLENALSEVSAYVSPKYRHNQIDDVQVNSSQLIELLNTMYSVFKQAGERDEQIHDVDEFDQVRANFNFLMSDIGLFIHDLFRESINRGKKIRALREAEKEFAEEKGTLVEHNNLLLSDLEQHKKIAFDAVENLAAHKAESIEIKKLHESMQSQIAELFSKVEKNIHDQEIQKRQFDELQAVYDKLSSVQDLLTKETQKVTAYELENKEQASHINKLTNQYEELNELHQSLLRQHNLIKDKAQKVKSELHDQIRILEDRVTFLNEEKIKRSQIPKQAEASRAKAVADLTTKLTNAHNRIRYLQQEIERLSTVKEKYFSGISNVGKVSFEQLMSSIKALSLTWLETLRHSLFTTSEIKTIKNSEYFDEDWYLNTYSDVKESGINPARHYFFYANSENRDPGPQFSTDYYLMNNPDVLSVGINALLHYELYGRDEDREINSPDIFSRNGVDNTTDNTQGFSQSPFTQSVVIKAAESKSKIKIDLVDCIKLKEVSLGKVNQVDYRTFGIELFIHLHGYNYDELERNNQTDFFKNEDFSITNSKLFENFENLLKRFSFIERVGTSVLRLTWHADEMNNEQPFVRIFQSTIHEQTDLSVFKHIADISLTKRSMYQDILMTNDYMPLLFVELDSNSYILKSYVMPFPSMSQGGMHNEMSYWESSSFVQQNVKLTQAFIERIKFDDSDISKLIELDVTACNGNEPAFSFDYIQWSHQALGIQAKVHNNAHTATINKLSTQYLYEKIDVKPMQISDMAVMRLSGLELPSLATMLDIELAEKSNRYRIITPYDFTLLAKISSPLKLKPLASDQIFSDVDKVPESNGYSGIIVQREMFKSEAQKILPIHPDSVLTEVAENQLFNINTYINAIDSTSEQLLSTLTSLLTQQNVKMNRLTIRIASGNTDFSQNKHRVLRLLEQENILVEFITDPCDIELKEKALLIFIHAGIVLFQPFALMQMCSKAVVDNISMVTCPVLVEKVITKKKNEITYDSTSVYLKHSKEELSVVSNGDDSEKLLTISYYPVLNVDPRLFVTNKLLDIKPWLSGIKEDLSERIDISFAELQNNLHHIQLNSVSAGWIKEELSNPEYQASIADYYSSRLNLNDLSQHTIVVHGEE